MPEITFTVQLTEDELDRLDAIGRRAAVEEPLAGVIAAARRFVRAEIDRILRQTPIPSVTPELCRRCEMILGEDHVCAPIEAWEERYAPRGDDIVISGAHRARRLDAAVTAHHYARPVPWLDGDVINVSIDYGVGFWTGGDEVPEWRPGSHGLVRLP